MLIGIGSSGRGSNLLTETEALNLFIRRIALVTLAVLLTKLMSCGCGEWVVVS